MKYEMKGNFDFPSNSISDEMMKKTKKEGRGIRLAIEMPFLQFRFASSVFSSYHILYTFETHSKTHLYHHSCSFTVRKSEREKSCW